MPIRTVIFDFDGTLASSLEGIHACFREALLTHGFAGPSLDDVRQTVGMTLDESVRRLTKEQAGPEKRAEVLDSYRAFYKEKGRAMATLFPGAKEALLSIREMGHRIVLVSNKSHTGLIHLAEHLGINEYVDMMLGADSTSFSKPDPRLYSETIAPKLPLPDGRQVLMVGDAESDLLFARNAELRSCWASYGYGDEAACRALAPEFILPEIAQLPGLIHALSD